MKTIASLVAAAVALLFITSCGIITPKSARELIRAATFEAATYAVQKDANARPYLEAAQVLICSLVDDEQPLDPDQLRDAVERWSVNEVRSVEGRRVLNIAIATYTTLFEAKAKEGVVSDAWIYECLSGICGGLTDAL